MDLIHQPGQVESVRFASLRLNLNIGALTVSDACRWPRHCDQPEAFLWRGKLRELLEHFHGAMKRFRLRYSILMDVDQRRCVWIVRGQDVVDTGIPPLIIRIAAPILQATYLLQAGTGRSVTCVNQPQLMFCTRRIAWDELT